MKKVIRFSRFFIPAAIISSLIVIFSITGYFTKGFTLGVDFQAGLIQEVQLAPTALSLRWHGTTNATLSYDRNNLYIVESGSGLESKTFVFPFSEYSTIGSFAGAIQQELDGIEIVSISVNERISPQWLVFSSQNNPYLNKETPYVIHYIDPESAPVSIADVRTAMAGFGQGVSVQNVGAPADRHFMVRVEDEDEGRVRSDQITQALENYFGLGGVAVLRSDYVGSRFSKDLTDQAGILIGLTLLLILIYAAIRFKAQFAVGAVIGIVNDAIVMVAFVVWTQMEFTTSTIAAILTILGYSINNTIVVFDRIRENARINPDSSVIDIMDLSLTAVLSRTIITTITTMLAVVFLFIFATGSMKDFALALLVGMTSGVYTTLFIASGFVYFWEKRKLKK
jgi:preprotein translocase subunit SecF